jgi:excisionase family DNA binding protein
MSIPATLPRWLTPPEIARSRGVSDEKVLRWITSGELKAVNLADHGSRRPRYRISPEALEAFDRGRQVIPPPKPTRRRRKTEEEVGEFY